MVLAELVAPVTMATKIDIKFCQFNGFFFSYACITTLNSESCLNQIESAMEL